MEPLPPQVLRPDEILRRLAMETERAVRHDRPLTVVVAPTGESTTATGRSTSGWRAPCDATTLQPGFPRARLGVAARPRQGTTPDTLLADARASAVDGTSAPTGAAHLQALVEVGSDTIVVADPARQRLVALTRDLARSTVPVLLNGPSGCGKEVFARALHAWSPRVGAPFVAVDCAASADGLLESELFGHGRGAFTGAHATARRQLPTCP